MLIADVRQEHHVAPLAMRWGPVFPAMEPTLSHPHQATQMAAGQGPAIFGNTLNRWENDPPDRFVIQLISHGF